MSVDKIFLSPACRNDLSARSVADVDVNTTLDAGSGYRSKENQPSYNTLGWIKICDFVIQKFLHVYLSLRVD